MENVFTGKMKLEGALRAPETSLQAPCVYKESVVAPSKVPPKSPSNKIRTALSLVEMAPS